MKMKPPRKSSRFAEPPPAPTATTSPALTLPDPALPIHAPQEPPAASTPAPVPPAPVVQRIDGRHRRATGRTVAFGTRVSDAWRLQLDRLADELGKSYSETLELALNALDRELQAKT